MHRSPALVAVFALVALCWPIADRLAAAPERLPVHAAATAGADQQASASAIPKQIDPTLPVFRIISGRKEPVRAFPDLAAALDPDKTYTVYCTNCTEYVVVADDDTSWKCEKQSEDQDPRKDCDDCKVVGYFRNGKFQARQNFFLSTPGYVVEGAAAAAVGLGFAMSGDDSSGSSGSTGGSVTPFTVASGRYQGTMTLQSAAAPCNNFTNPAVIEVTATVASDGTVTLVIRHVAVNVSFTHTGRLTRRGDGGFDATLGTAQTGSLTQAATASINSTGTQLTLTLMVGACTYVQTVLPKVS